MEKEKNQNLYDCLMELGLTENEANLYITSLSLGEIPLSDLAKALGISRPNIYKVIKTLERHGLAKFSDRDKYERGFIVESPTIVLEKLREKKEQIAKLDRELIPDLSNLLTKYHQSGGATKIKVIQGHDQFLKLFFQIIEEAEKTSEFFGSATDFIGFVSWKEEHKWIKERIKKGISIKSLLLDTVDARILARTDKTQMRETRILKTGNSFKASFQLFGNKVIIWQPKAPLAILIEDKLIFEMLKSVFYELWENSVKIEESGNLNLQ